MKNTLNHEETMKETLKQENVETQDAQLQQEKKKEVYVPPLIEVIQIKTERGYAGSLQRIPDEPWG